ncbi:VOC family protein [Pseudonocardia humida]|uniref:VOC family protein n=1 Tax=Pseudonocardia humida TaxID=2800819 RepID=A0ABT0ZWD0_9PSEU|nr:VOC family protein [Pseudonocardia humida]MCO1655042.1 VOC family protein [Pseudonocardia humida]
MRTRLSQIVVDSTDPAALVRFWAALLGGEAVDRARGWSHLDAPGFPRMAFQPVPEAKAVKNRLHLDVEVDAIPDATRVAIGLGAVAVGGATTDAQGSFQVLRDPEGDEFCLVSG